jgi:hypothetical protein
LKPAFASRKVLSAASRFAPSAALNNSFNQQMIEALQRTEGKRLMYQSPIAKKDAEWAFYSASSIMP